MKQFLAVAAVYALVLTRMASADVKLPNVISDHMVLERDTNVPIWGTASHGEKVTVKFRGQEKSTEAGPDGKWSIKLDPLSVGGPDDMTISGAKTISIKDVLVGEVWLGSGQSNMAINAGGFIPKDGVLVKYVAGTYPKMRLISPNGKWKEATPENNNAFSALMLSFGIALQNQLDEPVGLIVGAASGTPSGMWVTADQLDADAPFKAMVQKSMANYNADWDRKVYDQQMADYEKANLDYKAAVTTQPALKKPRKPVIAGKPGELPGSIKPGSLFEGIVQPYIPYAIRGVLWDQGETGTELRDIDQYTVMGALIKGWRHDWGEGDFPFLYVQKPSGTGPALDPSDPVTIAASKLAPLPAKVAAEGSYREIHIHIHQYPNTYMVTTSDMGTDTHPWNKSGYGARAARVAMGAVYGKPIEYYGPIYDSFKVEGNAIRIKFTHVGKGLVSGGSDKLQGFAIAGTDKHFFWADSAIEGETVVVHSDKVPNPVAVRYAYSQSIPWANLFNKDGLPALTFRTDSW